MKVIAVKASAAANPAAIRDASRALDKARVLDKTILDKALRIIIHLIKA
jgi:hypothetical protein